MDGNSEFGISKLPGVIFRGEMLVSGRVVSKNRWISKLVGTGDPRTLLYRVKPVKPQGPMILRVVPKPELYKIIKVYFG